VYLHGRGENANTIMDILDRLSLPKEYIVIAPQAYNSTWYSKKFNSIKQENQPYLNSALQTIESILLFLKTTYTIAPEHTILAGFSQGACLVAEYIKQNPQKYQGVAIFSGGLIGSDEEVMAHTQGNLQPSLVDIGCDEMDFHIPQYRVEISSKIISEMNARVTLKFYKNIGHTIHNEGITALQNFIYNDQSSE